MRTIEHTFDGRKCRITIGGGSLGSIGETSRVRAGVKALVVTDSNVGQLYADTVAAALGGAGVDCRVAVIPAGEASKSLARAEWLFDELGEMRLGRDGFLVGLGGGVVSDLTGFVAATWLRGVDFLICSTSLEGAVDASVGGKTAVNHRSGKNLIGAFHQPTNVIIDPVCLRTLERRELIAGLGESLKHGFIADESLVAWHEDNSEAILACDPSAMEELIARNVSIKAAVVERDARERNGERARLNFGHTVGHAIEAACEYELRHGECVALGMVAAARISESLGLLIAEDRRRIEEVVESFGLPVRRRGLAPWGVLAGYMAGDKKVVASRVCWVLLDGIGSTVLRDDVPEDVVRAAVDSLR